MKDDGLSVSCPTCGSLAGEICVLNAGEPRVTPHFERQLAVADQRGKQIVFEQAGSSKVDRRKKTRNQTSNGKTEAKARD